MRHWTGGGRDSSCPEAQMWLWRVTAMSPACHWRTLNKDSKFNMFWCCVDDVSEHELPIFRSFMLQLSAKLNWSNCRSRSPVSTKRAVWWEHTPRLEIPGYDTRRALDVYDAPELTGKVTAVGRLSQVKSVRDRPCVAVCVRASDSELWQELCDRNVEGTEPTQHALFLGCGIVSCDSEI